MKTLGHRREEIVETLGKLKAKEGSFGGDFLNALYWQPIGYVIYEKDPPPDLAADLPQTTTEGG